MAWKSRCMFAFYSDYGCTSYSGKEEQQTRHECKQVVSSIEYFFLFLWLSSKCLSGHSHSFLLERNQIKKIIVQKNVEKFIPPPQIIASVLKNHDEVTVEMLGSHLDSTQQMYTFVIKEQNQITFKNGNVIYSQQYY